MRLAIKDGFKKLKHGNCYKKYQRYSCQNCHHVFVPRKPKSSRYNSISLQAKITFEYLLNRSLRKVKTSGAVGRVGKDRILETALSVSQRLPSVPDLNRQIDIKWSGNFALDAFFTKIKGEHFAVLLCSDFVSLDLVGYHIADRENYESWANFLINIYAEITKKELLKFFVTDGKKGLHQALSQILPDTPTQLCTTHKQRRIEQIIPHIRGDGYDKLFCHLAHRAIRAPLKAIYDVYLNMLIDIQYDPEFIRTADEPRRNKLKKIIGALRFQKNKLHTRYSCPDLIDDPTTNHLEGINSFFKERLKLMKGFKRKENARLLIKLLIYYYRFHKFTSSGFKERNGKCPIELNQINNQEYLDKILKGKEPYSWIRNLLKPT